MGGIIGRLFHEFAVTIGVAVLVSGLVSLTLSPMMCSRFLRHAVGVRHGRLFALSEWVFQLMLRWYGWGLRAALRHRPSVLLPPRLSFAVVNQARLVMLARTARRVHPDHLAHRDQLVTLAQTPDPARLARLAKQALTAKREAKANLVPTAAPETRSLAQQAQQAHQAQTAQQAQPARRAALARTATMVLQALQEMLAHQAQMANQAAPVDPARRVSQAHKARALTAHHHDLLQATRRLLHKKSETPMLAPYVQLILLAFSPR